MRKMFPLSKPKQKEVISKAVIDEVTFNSQSLRDRLILELQSRCGIRIGEVLNIRVKDIDGRKIIVNNPKSGKEKEAIFMPEQVADRLRALEEG